MTKVNVYVTLRESVVDPQGIAAKDALHKLGFDEVGNVRIGRLIELELSGTQAEIEERVKKMCEVLLVNKVIEDYSFEIGEVAGK
ncbi:phosphoribosylformylglycinamidine synthase subunit PurS [Sporosarcina sp. Sa2YVA2]|uniref:Phosphoribosylformylglycinamidine synthase subunit PurS n=1 Tax=Sporosarcina quadrami TaxID=2762234 RepID=A0ABR8UET9_9BACL|nr:phosphoribosylformylglycinamidine synthase subunit PurS [Sporosarcina quadrami]MBD7986129.1 phosphoribosylformylglycinamidine synthase subunit PurS [Sporosarcina quadrami]